MASTYSDATIGDLDRASQIYSNDLFLLEQNGTAKALTGEKLVDYAKNAVGTVHIGTSDPPSQCNVWIDTDGTAAETPAASITVSGNKLVIADASGTDAVMKFKDDGSWHGLSAIGIQGDTGNGISSIEKTGETGSVDHYQITMTDSTTFEYDVTNGSGAVNSVNGKRGAVTLTANDITLKGSAKVDSLSDPLCNPNGRVVLIGDSYLVGEVIDAAGTVTTVDSWGVKLRSLAGGAVNNYHIGAMGKSGFVGTGETGIKNFQTLLSDVYTNLETDAKRNAVNLVIAGGGWNDKGADSTTLRNAVSAFCVSAKSYFPNARIIIACMGTHLLMDTDGSGRRAKVIKAYNAGAIQNGCECYSNAWEQLHISDSLIGADNCHPTAAGYYELAKGVCAYVRHSAIDSSNYFEDFSSKVTLYSNNSALAQCFYRIGKMVYFSITTLAYNHALGAKYFDLPDGYIPATSVMIPCIIANSTGACSYGALGIVGHSGDAPTGSIKGRATFRLGQGNTGAVGYLVCSGSFAIG